MADLNMISEKLFKLILNNENLLAGCMH